MTRTSTARGLAVWAVLASAALAAAQSNSLFGRRGVGGPASQPAGGVLGPGWPAPSGPASDVRPPKNPTLLASSPIAVSAPQPRRIAVHDLVTIVVREDKRSMTDSKLKSEKNWEVDSEFSRWFRLTDSYNLIGTAFPQPQPGVKFTFDNAYDGKGKVDRTDSLITRITARVIDVKPNGNIVIEATKVIEMDEERQFVTLTGECRSDDVTPQNTVLSTQVANLEIKARHSGAARDASRRGWLMRALDLARPM